MSTTRDRERLGRRASGLVASARQSSRSLRGSHHTHERALVEQYLAQVEQARQHEARALAQLRAGLAALGAEAPSRHATAHTAPAPLTSASVSRRASSRQRVVAQRRLLALGALALLLVMLGWAVFGGDEKSDSAAGVHAGHNMAGDTKIRLAPGSSIPVELGDFFIKPTYNKVRAGKITFDIKNTGKSEHELMVARVDELSKKQVEQLSSAQVHEKVVAAKHGLGPDSDGAELTVDLKPGKYLLFCNLPGHFAQGQHTILRVA